ncbi:alkylhydroperoxidase AhpD family core domain-containing protein [Mucilaginibacter sp. OK268]|uniref:carboxymuconolactone decarboxylase family protein n=1 Tax=Mucilaginibacter sp. OK268 TaxID=1881048 RepID=UPI000889E817|nr:carboxymuconolactone decarboxylase family protein [Mucilaginibacter sp. OK268]SDP81947.1 alkylhydroperoxidase AhpD family core domain-containing protein [Mucilaginibacter sp. OK268]
MKRRMNIDEAEPRIYKAMAVADKQWAEFELDRRLQELIRIRVSQINGCGYCIDYHTKDAIALGETTQRLFALATWWETPFFTEEEQTILQLATELTRIADHGVSDKTYENALRLLGKQKLAQVIFVTTTINSWNRIAIAMHLVAGED